MGIIVLATPVAFSPGSVTCFFSPSVHEAPEATYSRGLAINLSHGVVAALQPATELTTTLNGLPIELPSVRQVATSLAPESVALQFETALPLGCGFGVSAACALTAAFAIARRYDLPRSRTELGMAAHVAEVVHRTGYGDVASQLCGGFVYRRCRDGPLDSVRLSIPQRPLYYRVFGPLETALILGSVSKIAAITREGHEAVQWLQRHLEHLTLDDVLSRSLEFATAAGLITDQRVATTIEEVRAAGGSATMIMLGHSVLSTRAVPPIADWVSCSVDMAGTRWLP
jgi:pantoate kinase